MKRWMDWYSQFIIQEKRSKERLEKSSHMLEELNLGFERV
jgi:hypothetical protein